MMVSSGLDRIHWRSSVIKCWVATSFVVRRQRLVADALRGQRRYMDVVVQVMTSNSSRFR